MTNFSAISWEEQVILGEIMMMSALFKTNILKVGFL